MFSELWANFGGSLFMGFLSEDRMLFKEEWGTPIYDQEVEKAVADLRVVHREFSTKKPGQG